MNRPTDYALDTDQLLKIHQQGFLGPFRLWDEHETPQFRSMLEDFYIDNPDNSVPANNRHLKHAEIVELLRRPQLTDRMASVIGNDLFLWRIGAFNKQANDGLGKLEIPWHQDRNFWPIEPALVCSAWLAVDDVNVGNSALHFIPETHRQLIPHIPTVEGQAFPEQADPDYYDASKAVPMELKAGEFALFNERLLHWSRPNLSDRRRFGLGIRVLPPQVRVMDFDCEKHGLVQLRGGNPLGFNRLVEPPV